VNAMQGWQRVNSLGSGHPYNGSDWLWGRLREGRRAFSREPAPVNLPTSLGYLFGQSHVMAFGSFQIFVEEVLYLLLVLNCEMPVVWVAEGHIDDRAIFSQCRNTGWFCFGVYAERDIDLWGGNGVRQK
jgi:hypothetical protein